MEAISFQEAEAEGQVEWGLHWPFHYTRNPEVLRGLRKQVGDQEAAAEA